jgi:RNase H-fold protein (predicted Holliday junction resolvase)
MGLKKKARERKGIIDEVSAVMLLQEWLANNNS